MVKLAFDRKVGSPTGLVETRGCGFNGVWLSYTWIVVANCKLSVVLNFLPQSASAFLAFAIAIK
jgi:hypothetical protein